MSLFFRKLSHALPAPIVLLKGAPEKDEIWSIDIPDPNPILDILMLDPATLLPMNETSSEHYQDRLEIWLSMLSYSGLGFGFRIFWPKALQ